MAVKKYFPPAPFLNKKVEPMDILRFGVFLCAGFLNFFY